MTQSIYLYSTHNSQHPTDIRLCILPLLYYCLALVFHYFVRFLLFCRRNRLLVMAKHRSLDTLKMSEVPLLWEGTRILSSRLMDVQSRMNWVSSDGEGWLRILERGWPLAVVFICSGRILSRVPDRALHTAIIWVTDSVSAPHRVQEGLSPDWSLAALSAVKKSPDWYF